MLPTNCRNVVARWHVDALDLILLMRSDTLSEKAFQHSGIPANCKFLCRGIQVAFLPGEL